MCRHSHHLLRELETFVDFQPPSGVWNRDTFVVDLSINKIVKRGLDFCNCFIVVSIFVNVSQMSGFLKLFGTSF